MTRREKPSILADILTALEAERGRVDSVRLTNVAMRANIAYDRLQDYLDHLAAAGLVTDARPPALTEKGRDFLRRYRQWKRVLEDFGLDRVE